MKKTTKEQGVTLIALVITVIILIILATVTLSVVFGEGGLIQRAEQGKDLYEEAQKQEQQELLNTEAHLNELLGGMGGGTPEEPYVDESIVIPPQISNGMTPIKYDETSQKWIKTTVGDNSWYNYEEKKWANVVLVGENGKDADGDQDIFNSDGTLNEDSNYSMLVWIPRYAYKIKSDYHSKAGSGEIDIVFIDTENKGKDGKVTYKTTYPERPEYTGKIGGGGSMSDYVVHPAFDYGGTAIARILGRKV